MHTFTHSLTLSVSFSLPHSLCLSLCLSPLSSFVCVCMFLSFVHSHTYSTPSHADFCSDLNANMSVSTHADMGMHTAYPPSPPHTHTLTHLPPPQHTHTHSLSLSLSTRSHTPHTSKENGDTFDGLHRYSPLHNIPEEPKGGQYPAILLMTGDHDDRVVPLHSLKFIAELQHKLGKNEKQVSGLLFF